jgi:hypothetical protein
VAPKLQNATDIQLFGNPKIKRVKPSMPMTQPLKQMLPDNRQQMLKLVRLCSRNFSAELHRLVLNFLAACAESNSRNNSSENEDLFHKLLSKVSIVWPERLTHYLLCSRYVTANHRQSPLIGTSTAG